MDARSAVALALIGAAALAGCGAAHPGDPKTGRRIVHVVAGENFWGDIAAQIGGPHVVVTTIISDPSADPHLYESDPRDAARVATANLVIVNGAGYDDFMSKLLGASSGRRRAVLSAATVLHAGGGDPNPHLWYDIPRVPAVAAAIERALAHQDPADAPAFAARLTRFDRSLRPILATIAAIRRRDRGAVVAYSERVPGYLLAAAGLRVGTPAGFAAAVEDGNDPSARDTAAMDAAIASRRIRVLLDNVQATSPVTKQVRELAVKDGIPVVSVTETLPADEPSYQAWQLHQARELQRALGALAMSPATIELRGASMRFGARTLWDELDLVVEPGEFVAILGPNGAGKTTLIRVLLGLQALSAGTVAVAGAAPARGDSAIGYVPQQRAFDRDLPIRGRDLVRLGLDGHRWGLPIGAAGTHERVSAAIAAVGADGYADAPIGLLSGGEQQRLRIAQAIAGRPSVLLCDEPLLSLDPAHQHGVTELLDRQRREHDTTVLFVTHEINPVLPYVDRVLYLAEGRWAAGAPDDVFTSARLSALYGTAIDVLRVRDRIVVVGADHEGHHH